MTTHTTTTTTTTTAMPMILQPTNQESMVLPSSTEGTTMTTTTTTNPRPTEESSSTTMVDDSWDCLRPLPVHTLATYLQKHPERRGQQHPRTTTLLPQPWIHIGMPKTGTTTLEQFWKCGLNQPPPPPPTTTTTTTTVRSPTLPPRNYDDYYAPYDQVSHSTCKVTSKYLRDVAFDGEGIPSNPAASCPSNRIPPCQLCGSCMKRAKNWSLPLLASCGNYTAWAQLDTEEACYYPQLSALSEIHQEAPTATFLFLFRSIDRWIQSVKHFRKGFMLHRFGRCRLPYWQGRRHLKEWFCDVVKHARQFAAAHPTHTYIELDLEDPRTSQWASQAFGINESCWGKYNVNPWIHGNLTSK